MRDYDNFLVSCRELPLRERLRAGVDYFVSGFQANDSSVILIKNFSCKWFAIPCFIVSCICKK